MELTREEVERLASYNSATDGQAMYMEEFVARIAKQLLREMDKPWLWKDAPDSSCHMVGVFTDRNENKVGEFAYHRAPLKSRIDETAEEVANTEFNRDIADRPAFPKRDVADIIKSAILQARKEWEANR